MTTIRKASIAIAAAAVILALVCGLRGCGKKTPASNLAAERDSLAALGTGMLEMCDQALRGWKPEDFERELAEIAQRARQDGTRLREEADRRRSPAYQDLADWADEIVAFAGLVQRLGPDPGRPGYRDWNAEIDSLTSQVVEAEMKAFRPDSLQRGLKSADDMVAALTSAGFSADVAERDGKMLRDDARKLANDTPEGRAARARADVLRQKLDEMEAARPYTSVDIKPYLEDLAAAGETAIASVEHEMR